jgi:hypothetical protein
LQGGATKSDTASIMQGGPVADQVSAETDPAGVVQISHPKLVAIPVELQMKAFDSQGFDKP